MLKYTTINHEAKLQLNLTFIEYSIADSIYQLSTNPKAKNRGWCYASKQHLGDFIGVSREHVSRIITRLVELNLVEKNSGNSKLLRTTAKWYEAVIEVEKTVIKDHTLNSECDKRSHQTVIKDHTNCDNLSHPSNNNNNNNDIDRLSISEKIEERSESLKAEMAADQMLLELICMQQKIEMPAVLRLIDPWALDNAATNFQNTQHRRNSFKRFVINSQMKVSHKGSAPVTASGSSMLKPGESRRRVG